MRGAPEPGDAVLRILVELADVDEPRVWRQLLVPAAIRLDRLHPVIQDAMGRQNCHMHAFTIDSVQYGRPDGELGFANRVQADGLEPPEEVQGLSATAFSAHGSDFVRPREREHAACRSPWILRSIKPSMGSSWISPGC
ncbi:hypothetical protein ACFP51_16515 [Streptomyces pratens]|uniref:Plasmid pRiA4b Orf3-like domain-containing protein n=1 Tax=Streptomyces pratens TaxID=887456 RepID=A0ABW1LSU6_9ACTN